MYDRVFVMCVVISFVIFTHENSLSERMFSNCIDDSDNEYTSLREQIQKLSILDCENSITKLTQKNINQQQNQISPRDFRNKEILNDEE